MDALTKIKQFYVAKPIVPRKFMPKSIITGLVLTFVLAGCFGKNYEELEREASPTGARAAVTLVNVGGPTLSNTWAVQIATGNPTTTNECFVWESIGVGPARVKWKDVSSLEIDIYDIPRAHDYEWSFKPKTCDGVTVTWHYVAPPERKVSPLELLKGNR